MSKEWRCFHCGELFTKEWDAAAHFGRTEASVPACQLKPTDKGWVEIVRDLESENVRLMDALHNENGDIARRHAGQAGRHHKAVELVKEVEYGLGLQDGRRPPIVPEGWIGPKPTWLFILSNLHERLSIFSTGAGYLPDDDLRKLVEANINELRKYPDETQG